MAGNVKVPQPPKRTMADVLEGYDLLVDRKWREGGEKGSGPYYPIKSRESQDPSNIYALGTVAYKMLRAGIPLSYDTLRYAPAAMYREGAKGSMQVTGDTLADMVESKPGLKYLAKHPGREDLHYLAALLKLQGVVAKGEVARYNGKGKGKSSTRDVGVPYDAPAWERSVRELARQMDAGENAGGAVRSMFQTGVAGIPPEYDNYQLAREMAERNMNEVMGSFPTPKQNPLDELNRTMEFVRALKGFK